MNTAEQQLSEHLTRALSDGATAADLARMRLAIRQHPDLTVHAVHNALTIALENVAAAKFANEITR